MKIIKNNPFIIILATLILQVSLLLLVRWYLIGELRLFFVPWNIFLALISPAVLWYAHKKSYFLKFLCIFLGILFLPNTFYLFTDSIHIRFGSNMTVLIDTWIYVLLGCIGIITGYYSLLLCENFLNEKLSKIYTNISILILSGSISIGIIMGRMLRWNSWDIFTEPWTVFSESIFLFLWKIEINDIHRKMTSDAIGGVWAPPWLILCTYTIIIFSWYLLTKYILSHKQ